MAGKSSEPRSLADESGALSEAARTTGPLQTGRGAATNQQALRSEEPGLESCSAPYEARPRGLHCPTCLSFSALACEVSILFVTAAASVRAPEEQAVHAAGHRSEQLLQALFVKEGAGVGSSAVPRHRHPRIQVSAAPER